MSKNEEYIFLFGGEVYDDQDLDDGEYIISGMITVYDRKYGRFRVSPIRCPSQGMFPCHGFSAVLMHNDDNDAKLVFGFVNEYCRLLDIQLLPSYLIKLIGCWLSMENIH